MGRLHRNLLSSSRPLLKFRHPCTHGFVAGPLSFQLVVGQQILARGLPRRKVSHQRLAPSFINVSAWHEGIWCNGPRSSFVQQRSSDGPASRITTQAAIVRQTETDQFLHAPRAVCCSGSRLTMKSLKSRRPKRSWSEGNENLRRGVRTKEKIHPKQ